MRQTTPVLLRRLLITLVVAAPIAAVTATASSGASTPTAPAVAAAVAAAGPVTYVASADTQLNSGAPNTTYGGAVKMAVCGSGAATCSVDAANEKRALIKFSVAGSDGAVTSAKLRYYATTTPVPSLSVRRLTDELWTEAGATWNNSFGLPTAPELYTSPAGSSTGYYEADVTTAVTGDGTYGFSVTSVSGTTLRLASKESTAPIAAPQLVVTTAGTPGDPVIVAAGDISTRTKVGGNKLTSDLVLALNPDRVLTLGDDQYPEGSLADYQTYYGATWGRFKAKTSPVVGNHEYLADTSAAGYFTYFGAAASPLDAGCTANCKGYYSFDIGQWHVVVLNTNHNDCQQVACGATSEQLTWLQADLANTTQSCIATAFHDPRWSSGSRHGDNPAMSAIWTALRSANVDVVLNGHEHQYERFAKQNPAGQADPQGIRQFVVGTGGNGLYGFGAPKANSEVRNNTSKGVLKLTLRPGSYDWEFKPAAGFTFTDSGSSTCN